MWSKIKPETQISIYRIFFKSSIPVEGRRQQDLAEKKSLSLVSCIGYRKVDHYTHTSINHWIWRNPERVCFWLRQLSGAEGNPERTESHSNKSFLERESGQYICVPTLTSFKKAVTQSYLWKFGMVVTNTATIHRRKHKLCSKTGGKQLVRGLCTSRMYKR